MWFAGETAFTDEDRSTFRTLVQISSALSLLGTSFVIISYLMFREFREFHMRLIFCLSIADFLNSLVYIVGIHAVQMDENVACIISAVMLEYMCLSSALWTACIAHTLDSVIRSKNHQVERNEKWYHLICWGIPLSACVFLLSTQKYLQILGPADLWCWVRVSNWYIRGIFFYFPLTLIMAYVFITYVIVSYQLRKERKKIGSVVEGQGGYSILATFRWFLLALLICWAAAVINRIQNAVSDVKYPWLFGLQGFFVPLQGFFNAIIYGFNDQIRAKYSSIFNFKRKSYIQIGERTSVNILRDAINYDSDENPS